METQKGKGMERKDESKEGRTDKIARCKNNETAQHEKLSRLLKVSE